MWFIFPWTAWLYTRFLMFKISVVFNLHCQNPQKMTSFLVTLECFFVHFFHMIERVDKSHIKANLIFPLYILYNNIKICSNFCSLLLQVCITKQTIQFGRKQLKKLVYISIQKYAWEKWKFAVDGEVYFLTEKIDFPALTYSV